MAGFVARASWEDLAPYTDAGLRETIIDAVAHLEDLSVADLTTLLAQVGTP